MFSKGGVNIKYTDHSVMRCITRTGYSKKEIEELVRAAYHNGKFWYELKGPLSDYLKSKGNLKKVKYYNGIIFVFTKTSKRLLTMYPPNDDVMMRQIDYESGVN